MKELKRAFHKDMINIYTTAAKEINYKAKNFLDMVNKYGGYEAAKRLVMASGSTYGFEVLWENRRLDLSVEVLVLKEKYRSLFSHEIINSCKKRLKDFGYEIHDTNISKKHELYDAEYKANIGINKEQWLEMFVNSDIFTESNRELILRIYKMGGKATATELSLEEATHPSSYNAPVVALAKRIYKHLNIEVPVRENRENRWWHIIFWGDYRENGHFDWILRPELKDAVEQLLAKDKIKLKDITKGISEIRLIPMSKELEFANKSIDTVQQEFFINDLKNREECLYFFRSSGINCTKNTLLLFQYDNMIIASAKLKGIIKYETPYDGVYNCALHLECSSIKVFHPITLKEIIDIDHSFKRFSQAKQSLNIECLDDLLNLINKKKSVTIAEEIPEEDSDSLTEGAKKQIIINAYERNPKARQKCIDYHGTACKICGFDFGSVYGHELDGKIHVHHIKPLNEIDEEYQVDPIIDLIPICPNCHLVVHSKNPAYTPEEVKGMLRTQRS